MDSRRIARALLIGIVALQVSTAFAGPAKVKPIENGLLKVTLDSEARYRVLGKANTSAPIYVDVTLPPGSVVHYDHGNKPHANVMFDVHAVMLKSVERRTISILSRIQKGANTFERLPIRFQQEGDGVIISAKDKHWAITIQKE